MTDRMYVTAAEVTARSGSTLAARDINNVIAAVTDRIERETNRCFLVSETEARTFAPERAGYCFIDDLQSVDSVSADGVELTTSQYKLKRLKPGAAYHAITGEFDSDDELIITGVWGTTATVPPEIKDAAITWVRRIIKSDDAGGSQDATAIPELGQLVYSKAIPADVKRVLDRWRRWV